MRLRLVVIFVGITVAVLAAHDIPLALHLRDVERDRLITGLERDAFVIAGRASALLSAGNAAADPGLQTMVDGYREAEGGRVIVTDRDGFAMVISDAEAAAGRDYSTRPEIADALAGSTSQGERRSDTLDTELLYVAVPVLSGSDVLGAVRLTYPASEVDDRVADRVRGLAIVALISIITAMVAALVFAATVARPIRRLRTATERLAAGDLTVRAATTSGPPEVRALASSFDAMAERISTLVAAQRSFAGDASHQLRTPLTALRLRLERAAELVDDDPTGARDRIEAAGLEAERLQHLVDGLLALARSEGSVEPRATFDLAAIARERAEVWRPLAEEQGVDLGVDAPVRIDVLAIPGAIEQVVDNFVDNALGVAPAGSAVDLLVSVEASGRAGVHVLDRGPGMSHEHATMAFDRFWRGAGSSPGGSGLGLAIVDRLMRASGGTAALHPREGGGVDAAAEFEIVSS